MKSKKKNSSLTDNSKKLRKNMTKEEKHLWYDFLVKLPVTVNRQKVIDCYIVDFYCASANTVIELDGSQHYDVEGKLKDKIRDEYLRNLGITVLRYKNLQIYKSFDAVCRDILLHIYPEWL